MTIVTVLLAFGSVIERQFGRVAFVSIYLLAATAGALSQYLVTVDRAALGRPPANVLDVL